MMLPYYRLAIRAVGIALIGFLFFHLWGVPWALVGIGAMACLMLP